MRKFSRKLLFFLLVIVLTMCLFFCFGYYIIGNSFLDGYQASLLDKVDRMASISEPKILLVGNSNVNFGFRSDMIEDEFGMPVVNLGLHAGLGNAFHERIAKLGMKQGDILVLCHTSYSDDGLISDAPLAWITIEHHLQLWSLVDSMDYWNMIRAYPNYVFTSMMRRLSGSNVVSSNDAYSRNAFNRYGDIGFSRDTNSYTFFDGSISVPQINQSTVDRLNALDTYTKERGATLLIAGYPIAYGEFTPPRNQYDAFQLELDALLNCEIISKFTDYFIPYEYFYDTNMHLTDEGVEIRTKQLINDLHSWMD